jgi:cell division protein FtsN
VAKPYRVRIGRFTNRAEAADVVAKLKTEKTAAIIVEAERK